MLSEKREARSHFPFENGFDQPAFLSGSESSFFSNLADCNNVINSPLQAEDLHERVTAFSWQTATVAPKEDHEKSMPFWDAYYPFQLLWILREIKT